MRTLSDIIGKAREVPAPGASGGWPPGYSPKAKLLVPGESKLVLPGSLAGLTPIGDFGASILDLNSDDSAGARGVLLTDPGTIIPLRRPTAEELQHYPLEDSSRRVNARDIGLGICLRRVGGNMLYGAARLLVAENGLGFGSTLVLRCEESWTEDRHEFVTHLSDLCRDSAPHYEPKPDAKSKPWQVVTALLGGARSGDSLPNGWQREFRFAAGLYGISLDLRPNPESARAAVINDLQSKPPAALLVWANFVASPDSFIQPFLSARPSGYASLLGSQQQGSSYEDHLAELLMHLAEVSGLSSDRQSSPELKTWKEVKAEILLLEGKHFTLSDRARSMLDGNPYPKAERMYNQVRKLSLVAKTYHEQDGNLGAGFAEFSIVNHGIEVALTDKGLNPPEVRIDNVRQSFHAIPHVKVDDAKSPDQCGRIYFAIDQEQRRLVVDHIGLHDYG